MRTLGTACARGERGGTGSAIGPADSRQSDIPGKSSTYSAVTLLVALAVVLSACGGGSAVTGANSVCVLAEEASQAVLSGQGPYSGRESALSSDLRKASVPKASNADDEADLARSRSRAAAAIDAAAAVPKGDADALDDARGEVESALAEIKDNEICTEAASGLAPSTEADAGATEQGQPLIEALPRSTTHYKIDYKLDENDRSFLLTVTLFAVLNHAYQLPEYRAQLVEYKAEALTWLRSNGADPADYEIVYRPAEASAL